VTTQLQLINIIIVIIIIVVVVVRNGHHANSKNDRKFKAMTKIANGNQIV